MGFSRQEYWSVLPWLPPGYLLNVGTEPCSPAFQADSLLSEPPEKPMIIYQMLINYSCQNTEFESDRTASYKYQFTSIVEDMHMNQSHDTESESVSRSVMSNSL